MIEKTVKSSEMRRKIIDETVAHIDDETGHFAYGIPAGLKSNAKITYFDIAADRNYTIVNGRRIRLLNQIEVNVMRVNDAIGRGAVVKCSNGEVVSSIDSDWWITCGTRRYMVHAGDIANMARQIG